EGKYTARSGVSNISTLCLDVQTGWRERNRSESEDAAAAYVDVEVIRRPQEPAMTAGFSRDRQESGVAVECHHQGESEYDRKEHHSNRNHKLTNLLYRFASFCDAA
ncbi:MAG TPA: hypothetical protein VIT67_13610, partial [Povalibacter sp.]